MPKLDKRLTLLFELVRENTTFADIGCDHGYLAAELVLQGKAKRGYACDINEKPLEKARQTLQTCGVSDKVATVLTDGLQALPLPEIDDIIIAGMGGDLIAAILAGSPTVQNGRHRFVLQPMTKHGHLREYLYKNGYQICREQAVEENGKHYTVLQAAYTGVKQPYTDADILLGRLQEEQNEANTAYLRQQEYRLIKKLEGLQKTVPSVETEKTRRLLQHVSRLIKEWEACQL